MLQSAQRSRRRIRADRAQGSDRVKLFEQNFARAKVCTQRNRVDRRMQICASYRRCKRLFFVGRTKSVEEKSALAADQQMVLTCEQVSQSSAFALGSRPAAYAFGRNLPSRSHRLAS
jgi:hypothetical protein